MNIEIIIYYEKITRRWLAIIAGGWWMAYSSTKKGVINSVIKIFQKEWS